MRDFKRIRNRDITNFDDEVLCKRVEEPPGGVIAVVTGSRADFESFKNLAEEKETDFKMVSCFDDCRGANFQGYVFLKNWEKNVFVDPWYLRNNVFQCTNREAFKYKRGFNYKAEI